MYYNKKVSKEQVMIKVSSFTKYYGKFLEVDNISFHVQKGEIFGFIGQNGAGRTTTIRALLNLMSQLFEPI